jgi:hypothetical protein
MRAKMKELKPIGKAKIIEEHNINPEITENEEVYFYKDKEYYYYFVEV